MKRYLKRFMTVFLILALAAGTVAPVGAQAIQFEMLAPVTTTVTVSQLDVAGPDPSDTLDYLTDMDAVVEAVRQAMVNRVATISVPFTTKQYSENIMQDVFNAAIAHTGEPTQGDYLYWQMGQYSLGMGGYSYGDTYYLTLYIEIQYYTTAQQEAQMDVAVKAVLDELDVYDATDYEKVCAIYDYICNHVTYDYDGLEAQQSKMIYTAYAALINGKSVCQGYANLFYRLALELDVDARIVAGIGNGGAHGWNIVKLGGKYYNVDATWDASRAQLDMEYDYFLCCNDNFVDHTRDLEYLTPVFESQYPMASEDYTPTTGTVPGDIDGNGEVTTDDVVALLLHVSMPDLFPVGVPADFTGDSVVTTDDVIQLLLHVSMPDIFPLAA